MEKEMTRKEFLGVGTKAALSLFAITACGDLLSLRAHAKVAADELPLGPNNFLIKVDDLKDRGVANFQYQGRKAILLYNGGEIKAFENICTHKGGPTTLTKGKLVCKWHGAMFEPLTGKALKPPAPSDSSLRAIPLTVQQGNIFLLSKG